MVGAVEALSHKSGSEGLNGARETIEREEKSLAKEDRYRIRWRGKK